MKNLSRIKEREKRREEFALFMDSKIESPSHPQNDLIIISMQILHFPSVIVNKQMNLYNS